jgi:hypothetical protein
MIVKEIFYSILLEHDAKRWTRGIDTGSAVASSAVTILGRYPHVWLKKRHLDECVIDSFSCEVLMPTASFDKRFEQTSFVCPASLLADHRKHLPVVEESVHWSAM